MISFVCIVFSANYSYGKTFNPAHIAPWSCPPVNANSPPDPETDWGSTGDRLYIRIVDMAGNDIEIWCIDGWSWKWYYQMEISFPNGKTVLSECELSGGDNRHTVIYDGTLDWVTTPSGSKLANINGSLLTYLHENLNAFKDYHNYYNFSSGEAKRVDTQKFFNGTVKIKDTTKKQIDSSDPPWSIFAWSGDFDDLNDSETMGDETSVCSVVQDDFSEIIHLDEISVNVGNTPTTFELFYPADVGIANTIFDEEAKSLTVLFGQEDIEKTHLSISIPRDLLDHSETESFMVSSSTKGGILFEESTTDTYRTLNMDFPSYTESIEITGTEVFKQLPPQTEDVFKVFAPKKQIALGVPLEKIICNNGMELIFKSSESAACVKPSTAQKLLERNWVSRII